MISSENELAAEYNISRMTARTAITHLVGAGLLYRIHGKGTFVAAPKNIPRTPSYTCIRNQLELHGTEIQTNILTLEERPATQGIANHLNITADSPVYYMESIRIADNEPIYISHSYFSPTICPGLLEKGLGTIKTCDVLKNNYHIVSHHIHETLMSSIASFEESEHLQIIPGHPLLLLTETYYTETNVPYEYSQLSFRGDKIHLSFDFYSDEQ
jgi:GntR family transcriptional regulator